MATRSRLLLLLALLLLLTACAPAAVADDFAYAGTAFTATVRGTYTPSDGVSRPIEAKVTIDAPNADGRGMSLTFASPAALSGVTVSAAWAPDGNGIPRQAVTFTAPSAYGTVTATADGGTLGGFLRFAEALLPRGDITTVTPVDENDTRVVTRKTADGAWEGVYTFAEGRSLPLRVTVTSEGERLELAVEP